MALSGIESSRFVPAKSASCVNDGGTMHCSWFSNEKSEKSYFSAPLTPCHIFAKAFLSVSSAVDLRLPRFIAGIANVAVAGHAGIDGSTG